MLSLSQVARYNELRKQCLVHNETRATSIVPYNEYTCESVKCTQLPEIQAATETYINWILSLPIHMCISDRKRLAKQVAKVVVQHHQRLTAQRNNIRS